MGAIYTPNANIVANILNRRSDTEVVDTFKELTVFANLVKTQQIFGDTLEHVQKSLSEKKNYDPKQTISGKYVATILNKIYNKETFSKTYYESSTPAELRKALKNPKALADLIQSIENSELKSWAYDMYYIFIAMFEADFEMPYIVTQDFSTFATDTKDVREDKIEKFLQQVMETQHDMRFYSNRYITVDSTLTAEAQGRLVGTAPEDQITIYINKVYSSWVDIDLTKRFSTDKVKINKEVVDFQNDNKVCYIVHNGRYSLVPLNYYQESEKQFGTGGRVDHALSIEMIKATIGLYPAVVMVIDDTQPIADGMTTPANKGTRYEDVEETADSV